ncbi:MAG TPA: hypothetical protein V6C58_17240, partial [Allocoleopsis sp.]
MTGIAALAYSTECSDFTNYTKSNPAGAALALRNWILTSGVSLKELEGKTVTTQRVNAFNVLNKVTRFCGSCLQPTNIEFLTKTNSTEVLMSLPNNTDTITIRYRKTGDNNWLVFKQKSDPVYLNDLQPCTNYEFELSNQCQGVTTNTGRYQFKTDGCCQAPPDLNIQEVATNKFVLNVTPVTIATSYKVKITEGGATDTQDFNDNILTINNLKSCKKYNVSISSVCENKLSDALNFNLKTKGCGACLEQPYCLVNGISQLEWIDSFRIHNFRIKTGDNSGYFRSDSVITVLNHGKKYPIGLSSGYVFIDFQESARV